jgi:hypothetical protein
VRCASWMHFLFGFLIHKLSWEIVQSLWFRNLQCGTVIRNMKWPLSGYMHKREIEPTSYNNSGSLHFEKSKNYLNYSQFWRVLWWKSSIPWGLWNNWNWWYLFFDSEYFQKT